MNKLKKIYVNIIVIVAAVFFICLPIKMNYVTGITGNSDGYFVIGISLLNSENRHDLLFYNSDCLMINKITLYKRGGISIGSYNDYLIVQDGLSKSEIYDFYGNKIPASDFELNKKIFSEFYYYGNDYAIEYKQDIDGDEKVIYHGNNGDIDVDFNYASYKKNKYIKTSFQIIVVIFVFLIFQMYKRKERK
mgnify:FL=1